MAHRLGILLFAVLLGAVALRFALGRAINPVLAGEESRALGASPIARQPPPSAPASGPSVPLSSGIAVSSDPAMIGKWHGRLDTPLVALARANPKATLPVERIRLTLSPHESATVLIDHFETSSDTEGVFEGTVEGKPGSTVILSYVGLAQAGMVHLPAEGRVFRIRGNDDGTVHITEVGLSLAPECANCIASAGTELPPLPQP